MVRCVLDAIDAGYRHFDTAQCYFNEAELGEAIKESGLPRQDFFITTKIWIDFYGYDKTKASLDVSLKKLKTDYIDAVLLHQPFNDYYGAYRALEDLYDEGVIKAIGLSNFEPDHLCDLIAFNRITPQIDQVITNPFCQQIKSHEIMVEKNVQHCAWSPFAQGLGELVENEKLAEIAGKYGKSVPQIILRWLTQRDIAVLSKTTHKERMKENLEIFDFTIADEDMQKIAELDNERVVYFDIRDPKTLDMFLDLIEKRRELF